MDVLQLVPMQPTFNLVWFHTLNVSLQFQLRSWGVITEESGIQDSSIGSPLMANVLPVTKNVMTCGFTGASPGFPNCNMASLEMNSISATPSLFFTSRSSENVHGSHDVSRPCTPETDDTIQDEQANILCYCEIVEYMN